MPNPRACSHLHRDGARAGPEDPSATLDPGKPAGEGEVPHTHVPLLGTPPPLIWGPSPVPAMLGLPQFSEEKPGLGEARGLTGRNGAAVGGGFRPGADCSGWAARTRGSVACPVHERDT